MNRVLFTQTLEKHYSRLFETSEYAFAAARHTPKTLAEKMAGSLRAGTANKDGEGIKLTCKELGIKYTCAAIKEFLN